MCIRDSFNRLIEKYQSEQEELLKQIGTLENALQEVKDNQRNAVRWADLMAEYVGIQELTAENLNLLIERIEVFDRTETDGEALQTIRICYRFGGYIGERTFKAKVLKHPCKKQACPCLLYTSNQWNEHDWLFTQDNGEIMNPQTPTKQFSKFLARNHLKHRKLHSLRHTSATLLLYGGVNIKQVQERLGHGDITTTNKYLHYISEADEQAANVLQDMLITHKTKEQKTG